MGLLDDAIREHLELKRRRGADPAEVAREQQEALEALSDAVPPSDPDANTQEHPLEERLASDDATFAPEEMAQPEAISDHPGVEPARAETPSPDVSQVTAGEEDAGRLEETAELDMNAVFEDEPMVGAEQAQHAEHPERGAPEREVPSDLESGRASQTPEQERLRFEHGPQADSASER